MNMALIDWLFVGGLFIVIAFVSVYTKRSTRGVADFLSANRCAGRYMLTMGEGMAGLSGLAIIAFFEMYYQAGFPAMWWMYMLIPIGLIINMSGWVTYRFRETRALTMAQFFEIRYSKKFRVFSGTICWISGILNYGIFPGVTARLLIYLCGLPSSFELFGFSVSVFPIVMFLMLSLALMLALPGGQIALMVTDFLQSQFTNITFVVIMSFFLFKFGWENILEGLQEVPEGKSMLDPFKQSDIPDFNVWYFVMLAFVNFYGFKAWQGSQGYYSSARNAHEAKMAGILGSLRGSLMQYLIVFIPIVVFFFLHHPDWAKEAASIQSSLASISDPQVRTQMIIPLALTKMLPIGVFGMFVTVIIAATVSTDDTYLHSWGSVFVQDVIMPFRKKTLTAKQHLLWLRLSIVGVAIFAFFFSLFFRLKDFIFMYWQITGAIFVGGAGSAIIGGLYWKRGTTLGAWCGMITGSVLAVGGIILQLIWSDIPALKNIMPEFPLNGMQLSFFASVSAIIIYVIASLISREQPFNMNKLLHRGKYSIEGEHVQVNKASLAFRLFGMGSEFTPGDRITYILIFLWGNIWFVPFVIITIIALVYGLAETFWTHWWYFAVHLSVAGGVVVTTWYLLGGMKDIVKLFRGLKAARQYDLDDGTVVEHHNLVDEPLGVPDDNNKAE